MISCNQCKTELAATPDARTLRSELRCASCGTLFRIGNHDLISPDKNAWRSLWLGLSSILFACLTGIPAMYYGISSFLQMRHSPTRSRDQTAAAAGITLGCFGTVVVSMIALVGGSFLIAGFFFTEQSNEPAEVLAIQQKICQVELPEILKPERSSAAIDQVEIAYFSDRTSLGDAQEKTPATARLAVTRFVPQFEFNRIKFGSNLAKLELSRGWSLVATKTTKKTLNWTIDGETIPVSKTIQEYPDSVSTVRYVAFLKDQLGRNGRKEDRGIAIKFKMPHESFDESTVQKIFESFRPPAQ